MSAKQKHVVIAIKQKLKVVRRIKNGEILRNVGRISVLAYQRFQIG
jgi:hypothetical protein